MFLRYIGRNIKKMEKIEFEHYVATLRQKLTRYASHYLSDDEAEDAVQETLIKLWQLRHRISDEAHMQHLAMVVVRNTSISILRHHNTEHTTSLEVSSVQPVSSDNIHTQMETRETEEWLHHCIHSLPDKQRAILQMRNVEQLSYSDIAHIIGATESSVRVTISRARKTLLQQLKNREK